MQEVPLLDTSQDLVHVKRGPLVESRHAGHIVVADSEGSIRYYAGNYSYLCFARSAAKPLQAIRVVESGAAARAGLTEAELALCCASHSGQQEHTYAAKSILAKAGLTPEALQCGDQVPWHQPTALAMAESGHKPDSLHNNCSGKHAGMLLLAVDSGWPISHYTAPSHPVQQRMLLTVASMCGLRPQQVILGTDGCGVPVFGVPLASLAAAYARLGSPDRLNEPLADAASRLLNAIRHNPLYIAGEDRFDTELVRITNGRLIGKMGAEGVYGLTIPELGLGLAVKIEDGAERALYPAVMEALVQLGMLNADEGTRLAAYHKPPVLNRRGETVGQIVPVFKLKRA
jgi:L-asparaginase II